MGNWQYIRTEIEDRIATLTIDHPPVNSFNRQVVTELEEAIDELLANDEVKAIVITGGGTNAFVAGADIPEIKALLDNPGENYAASREFIEKGQRLFLKIERATKPIIAAINGFALGGGLELALMADCLVLGDTARLGLPETSLGLVPGAGGGQRLMALVGRARATRLVLTGEIIDAAPAFAWGIAGWRAEGPALPLAEDLAARLALRAPLALQAAKRALVAGSEGGLDFAGERAGFETLLGSADKAEGIRAFRDRRKPQFRGE
ncbi:MAG: enoyl-CoA hydratase-related protein [Anaerolineae bacterium]|nr:enoyl-CoA hydratase-related protein [Anaerolineae bacterium]